MWVILWRRGGHRRLGLAASVLPFTVLTRCLPNPVCSGRCRGSPALLDQATRLSRAAGESLLGSPIQAFADTLSALPRVRPALMMTGAVNFFINTPLLGHFYRLRGQGVLLCVLPARQ